MPPGGLPADASATPPVARKARLSPALYIALALAFCAVLLFVFGGMSRGQVLPDTSAAFLAANRSHDKAVIETASGLQYKVLKRGKGPATPTDADVALVGYRGMLTDKTVFDQSATPVKLPVAEMVPGFSEALKLMPRGARYRVWLKPALGYGANATGPIPGNSVLVFDIDMVDFRPVERAGELVG